MLASQLLYTSWKNGNSTTKGYMVYSKTRDISDIEESEICAVMKYKAPDDLPYTPTPEEIETLFPKIFAYFKLSSGRFCIAQSAYIGQDYTNRWGNYIIHAYVFDDIGDLIPSKMIGKNIFRTRLTEDELNAPAAPESLPKVEIDNEGNALTEKEIKSFFDSPDKVKMLKILAQNVCDAVINKKRINFTDDLVNMRTWITALSMIVPKNILKEVYFSTYSTESSELLVLSCKQSKASAGFTPSYCPVDVVNIDAKQYEGDTKIGCYFDAVCNRLTDGYYEGILCANNVSKMMADYKFDDYNLAYKLAYVKQGELDYIVSNKELLDIMKLLSKNEPASVAEVFEKIFNQYRTSKFSTGDESSLAVFKALYPHISTESKVNLMMIYVDGKLESDKAPASVYEEIKKDCPCEWNEAVMHILRQTFREHLEEKGTKAAELLICNGWITVYAKCNSDQREKAFEQISALYAKQVASRDMQSVNCILKACVNVEEALFTSVYASVTKTSADILANDDAYLFEYLNIAIDNGALFWKVLINIISAFPDAEENCIQRFVALKTASQAKVSELMRYAESNPPIRAFLDNVDMYSFKNSQMRNSDDLIDCYNKYVKGCKGSAETKTKCREIFTQKVRNMLGACDEKESIKLSVALYDGIYNGKNLSEDEDIEMITLLASTIYDDHAKDIAFINKCLAKNSFAVTASILAACNSLQIQEYPRALLIYEGFCFEKVRNSKEAKAKVLKWFKDNNFTYLSKSCDKKLVREFLQSYMNSLLSGMYMISKEYANATATEIINYFLEPISAAYPGFADDLVKAWKDDVTMTNDHMYIYFLYGFENSEKSMPKHDEKSEEEKTSKLDGKDTSAFADVIKANVEDYLTRLGKGKRNDLFEEMIRYFGAYNKGSYKEKMEAYMKDFQKDHKTVWDKIKNIFAVKESKKDNGEKK